jgi:chromosomal replication initiator protein
MSSKSYINDHVRFMTVVQAVSSVTGIKREHIFGRRRLRRYADARHMAMFLTRQSTKLTVQRIGKLFDRDHSTVVHASNSVQSLIDISDNYKDDFNEIVNEYDRLIKDLQPDPIDVIVE